MSEQQRGPIILLPITPQIVTTFKAVRLRALQDSPSAFGSTFSRESEFTDAQWLARASQWNGDRSAAWLAMDERAACGIVAGFLDEFDASIAHLVSMWVAPAYRCRGVGRMLVDATRAWASRRDVLRLRLMVVSNNLAAMEFYQRLGFTSTGKTTAYPNDSSLIQFEMEAMVSDAERDDEHAC